MKFNDHWKQYLVLLWGVASICWLCVWLQRSFFVYWLWRFWQLKAARTYFASKFGLLGIT